MKQFKIKNSTSGNCACRNCGKVQDGLKLQPFTVWWKEETEKRGHQEPMCSIECCEKYIKRKEKQTIADKIINAKDTTEMAQIIYKMCVSLSEDNNFTCVHIKMALESQ